MQNAHDVQVVGGFTDDCGDRAEALIRRVGDTIVPRAPTGEQRVLASAPRLGPSCVASPESQARVIFLSRRYLALPTDCATAGPTGKDLRSSKARSCASWTEPSCSAGPRQPPAPHSPTGG